jgi:hypothetical protein
MIAVPHDQRSFRAEQTGSFFLLRSCEVAGLRRRGISLRSIRKHRCPRLRSDRLPPTVAAASFATTEPQKSRPPPSWPNVIKPNPYPLARPNPPHPSPARNLCLHRSSLPYRAERLPIKLSRNLPCSPRPTARSFHCIGQRPINCGSSRLRPRPPPARHSRRIRCPSSQINRLQSAAPTLTKRESR